MQPMPPWTDVGTLQQEIYSIKSELHRKANEYEVTALNSNISDLARAIRETGSILNEFLCRLEMCEEKIRKIEESNYDSNPEQD